MKLTRFHAGAVVAAALLAGAGGCRGGAKTPEEAYRRFSRVVQAGDAAGLYEALDQKSRWAWMTVQKSHREAYDIILSNYPAGRERERELRRFERGATLGSARELFIEEVGRAALPGLRALVGEGARIESASDGETAVAILPSGARAPLKRSPRGGWGFGGFAEDSEDRQKRALGDVDLVRTSAADYERAAARGAR